MCCVTRADICWRQTWKLPENIGENDTDSKSQIFSSEKCSIFRFLISTFKFEILCLIELTCPRYRPRVKIAKTSNSKTKVVHEKCGQGENAQHLWRWIICSKHVLGQVLDTCGGTNIYINTRSQRVLRALTSGWKPFGTQTVSSTITSNWIGSCVCIRWVCVCIRWGKKGHRDQRINERAWRF